MRVEQIEAALLHLQKGRALPPLRQIGADCLAEDVVRARVIGERGAVFINQAVPVGHAGVEGAPVPAQRRLHGGDELGGLLGGNLVGRVVEHPLLLVRLALVGKRNEVGADGRFVVLHFDAHAQRLQRAAPAGIGARVIAHNGQIRRVALGRHPLGNGVDEAVDAHRGEIVHIRLLCRRQRRLPLQPRAWLVGHTVADHHNIFHRHLPALPTEFYAAFPPRRKALQGLETPSPRYIIA